MPRLIITEGAAQRVDRCRKFLEEKEPEVARRAGEAISRRFVSPSAVPLMGRPFDTEMTLRELVISFGESGYVALYRYDATEDAIYILSFRHQREAGY